MGPSRGARCGEYTTRRGASSRSDRRRGAANGLARTRRIVARSPRASRLALPPCGDGPCRRRCPFVPVRRLHLFPHGAGRIRARWPSPSCGCGSRRGGLRLGRAALVGLSALALFTLWEGLSIAWSVGPDLSWLAFDVSLLYLIVAAVVTATPAGPAQLRLAGYGYVWRHGAGGRLCLPRKSVARQGDARPSVRPPERSDRLLERAGHHARHGDRAGARRRLAPRPAGRGARRLRRRARALPVHPVLHLLARRHARAGDRPRGLLRAHQRAPAGRAHAWR